MEDDKSRQGFKWEIKRTVELNSICIEIRGKLAIMRCLGM